MRFIGNKEKLLPNIYKEIESLGFKNGDCFCDFFSGTSNVGRHFKEKGFKIISSDLLFFSYVLQEAYIKNNEEPKFEKLLKEIKVKNTRLFNSPINNVVDYLNNIKGAKGFIYKNYTPEGTTNSEIIRMYFTGKNGSKIDAIRKKIENWKKNELIKDSEYYILLAILIESVPFYSNISGVYGAFLKKYDPRALKDFELKPINFYKSKNNHKVFNKNSMDLIEDLDVDILYLDPPYNGRQYGGNYHVLETIARYDNPEIKGITGMRNYDDQKSEFCNTEKALSALDKIAKKSKYKILVLSYNSEGIMPQKKIETVLNKYGNLKVKEIDYLRFKSNSNGDSKHKKHIKEQLYILNRK